MMRRTASEVLRSLEARVARLEGRVKTATSTRILKEIGWKKPYRASYKNKERGLGVAMFIKDDLARGVLPSAEYIDSMWVEVFVSDETWKDLDLDKEEFEFYDSYSDRLRSHETHTFIYSASTVTKYTLVLNGIDRTIEIMICSSGEGPMRQHKYGEMTISADEIKVSKIICNSFSTNGRLPDETYNKTISLNTTVERWGDEGASGVINKSFLNLLKDIKANAETELKMVYGTI